MVVKNEKGILSAGYSLTVAGSKFYGNDEYGVRLYGGGKIEKCGFKDNLVGIVLEQGRGSARIEGCRIELSRMDGIVSGAVNSEITDNLIASNGRNGIYLRDGANPNIALNDIINNRTHAVSGGGRVVRSFIAYNNGSPYYDDTEEKGRPDNVFSSSSSGLMKQILNADYISALSFSSVLR
jgi:parallel beta-helix repeat protein